MDAKNNKKNEESEEAIIKKLMKIDYEYPSPKDEDFLKKIYSKREYYINKIQARNELKTYEDIKNYRTKICTRQFALHEHQSFLSNFINPETPYKGVLVYHGTGTGKCISGDSLITTNKGLIEIKRIWNMNNGIILKDTDDGLWSNIDNPITVTSYDKKREMIHDVPIKRLYKQYIKEYIKVVKLMNNKEIICTLSHKLLTNEGWKSNISLNDQIYAKNINGKYEFVKIMDIIYKYVEMDVYDLEIDNYHNYLANDIFCHNTCASIAMAEKFKNQVQRYGTKIYVLVPGPLLKANWKNEILKCTGETYIKKNDSSMHISDIDKNKMQKVAINNTSQYYYVMSYRSFGKKVLGERIADKISNDGGKVKAVYRKTQEGEFERDVAIDRIYNLNNSVLIIDEAHALTGNTWGDSVKKIINNSINLRVVLLTATPMKNVADDIIGLLNFLRPSDAQIDRERIFTSNKNHLMDIKPGGLEYLKKMAVGYVSYLRGADPLTFAKRVEMGTVPKGLLFTKVIQCKMGDFQLKTYLTTIEAIHDSLDRKSEAVANFAFPILSDNKSEIIGTYGKEGLNKLKLQIKAHKNLLNQKIGELLGVDSNSMMENEFVYLSDGDRTVSGSILNIKYLKFFSTKFYEALTNISKLYWGQKGAKTVFVYSNLVKVGIEMFKQVLLQNGYIEYDENPGNYKILQNTICYYCGQPYKEHINKDTNITITVNDEKKQVPKHTFYPATFISVTGKSSEELLDIDPEDRQQILTNIFSNIENKEGKHIKIVLGSKVMNEGISLKNVFEVHILDVYFTLGRVDQIIGRAIRQCSHYGVIDDNNKYPQVEIYKYAITMGNGELTSEEDLYKKAEMKYLLIKKVERALKEVAIDCPLNRNGNIFPEERTEYNDCVVPGEQITNNKQICPGMCDFMRCEFKCDSDILNKYYWDDTTKSYKKINKEELDYTTFTEVLARSEIETVKSRIKELYRIKFVYTLEVILKKVKESYSGEKKDLFDDFFCFKALSELIPMTENDFNNFKDTIFDKFNRPGYLIFINKYYIYQPFDQNEDIFMYYRSTYNQITHQPMTLYNYLKHDNKFKEYEKQVTQIEDDLTTQSTTDIYDFSSVMEYYDNREEYDYVGIIDKESIKNKDRETNILQSVFKIREKRPKNIKKQRDTDLPTLKGAVCVTKDKAFIKNLANKLRISLPKNTRNLLCRAIKNELLNREKYSRGKNKITYVIIPKNHEKYKFPYNLEDRVEYIIDQIKQHIKFGIDIDIKEISKGNYFEYILKIGSKNFKDLEKFDKLMVSLGGVLEGDTYVYNIN